MFNQDSSPYLNCCVFRGNSGFWGGGFFSGRRGATVSSPTVLDCLFNGNSSTEFGGGIYDQTATSVINSVFIGNYSGADGGGVFAMSDAETINCTFVGNNADSHGGAAARGVLRNCILWGNSAHIQPEVSFATTSYCDIRGGDSGTGTIDSDPMFVRTPSPGPDLKWGTLDDDLGDLHPRCFSPVVDAGDSDALPDGVGTDFAGNSRFVDFPTVPDAITRLRPAVDIGAYELSANLHADAGGPYFAIPGENLTLHGHGIADSVGTLTFAWEWTGDGAFDDAIGQNPVIDISGMTVGEQRTIQLRVTDSLGQSVEDSSVLTIMPTVVYVDARASGAGDGTNWMNAFPRLSDALHLAVSGQTIKVAAGVYLPSSWGDTSASFILKNGVSLLGGFAGLGAPNPHTRDAGRYVTTLSGNFGHVGFEPDRSYHVIEASGTDATAVLDGFNITGGYAVYFGASFYVAGGGGLYAQSGSPTISNCVFLENGSMDRGGGAYFFYNSNPTLLNCKFIRNTADGDYGGGLCLVNNCHATLVDCEFLGNTVPNSGGALWIYYSSPTVVNCSFVGNRSKYGSALTLTGIYNYPKQTTTMVNCTITGNQPLVGDSIFDDGELLSSKNSILWGNIEPAGGVPAVDPRFVRNPSAGPDNTWGTADDDYGDLRLRIDSPCIDAGDNSAVPAGITTDIAGNPRFIDIPGVHDPGAIVDMGAYERIAPIADAGYLFDAVRPTVSVKFGFDALASSIAPSDLLLTNLTTGQALDCGKLCTVSYDSLTRTASWVFNAALPDGNYRAILPVNSVSDDTGSPALGANVTLDFFALGGDANRDRIVDINDLSILSMNWQGSNKLFSQGDFNYDGKVDAKDLGILSSHWQRSLPPPVPTAPVRAPTRTPVRIATLVL
jgi:predicted outer membrane repeat protein